MQERIISGHDGRELRAPLPDRATLIATAIQTRNFSKLPSILARQASIFYGQSSAGVYGRRTSIDSMITAMAMLFGLDPIPFSVLTTCEAIMRHAVPADIDPRLLNRAIEYEPPADELLAWGVTDDKLKLARTRPPIRSGSVVWVHFDGIDDNVIWMREVLSGPYRGRLTTGGGYADNPLEVTALEEAREEAGIDSFCRAEPLGLADQIVAIEKDGRIGLERFANYLWVYSLRHGERPHNTETGRKWVEVYDDETERLLEKRAFTPIAECALRLIGPPFTNERLRY